MMISASPFSTTGDATSSPYFTYVTTEPPLWLMPCTSETFTSKFCESRTFPIIREASSEPCPPTPTIIIDLVSIYLFTSELSLVCLSLSLSLKSPLRYLNSITGSVTAATIRNGQMTRIVTIRLSPNILLNDSVKLAHLCADAAAYALGMVDNALAVLH